MSGGMAADNSGTTPVRENFRFDEARLAEWMAANVAGFAGPMVVEQFKGGQSNPTYKLVTPGKSYVLRRKPPGQLLKGAHAVQAATVRILNQREVATNGSFRRNVQYHGTKCGAAHSAV